MYYQWKCVYEKKKTEMCIIFISNFKCRKLIFLFFHNFPCSPHAHWSIFVCCWIFRNWKDFFYFVSPLTNHYLCHIRLENFKNKKKYKNTLVLLALINANFKNKMQQSTTILLSIFCLLSLSSSPTLSSSLLLQVTGEC